MSRLRTTKTLEEIVNSQKETIQNRPFKEIIKDIETKHRISNKIDARLKKASSTPQMFRAISTMKQRDEEKNQNDPPTLNSKPKQLSLFATQNTQYQNYLKVPKLKQFNDNKSKRTIFSLKQSSIESLPKEEPMFRPQDKKMSCPNLAQASSQLVSHAKSRNSKQIALTKTEHASQIQTTTFRPNSDVMNQFLSSRNSENLPEKYQTCNGRFMEGRLQLKKDFSSISQYTSQINTRVKEQHKYLEKIQKKNQRSSVAEVEYYNSNEKAIKSNSFQFINLLEAKLSNILLSKYHQRAQQTLVARQVYQFNLKEVSMLYFTLNSGQKQLPLKLNVKKPKQDMRLTVYFSKYHKTPNIDEHDESFTDQNYGKSYTLTIGKNITSHRFGNCLYYLGIMSNQAGQIELSINFTVQNMKISQKQLLEPLPTKPRSSSRVQYQKLKDQVLELMNDDQKFATFQQRIQELKEKRSGSLQSQTKRLRMSGTMNLKDEYENHKDEMTYNQYKLERFMKQRKQILEEDRKRKIFYIFKRDLLKDYKQKKMKEAFSQKRQKETIKHWFLHLQTRKIFKRFLGGFKRKQVEKMRARRLLTTVVKIQYRFRRILHKRVRSYSNLCRNYIRKYLQFLQTHFSTLIMQAQAKHRACEIKALSTLKLFFKDILYQKKKINLFRKFIDGIIHIQRRFKNHMSMLNIRVQLLTKHWEDTKAEMITLIQKNPKTRKNQLLIMKLVQIDNRVRDHLITKYLNKCYVQYNSVFFAWHSLFANSQKNDQLKFQFIGSLNRINEKEDKMIDLFMEQQALQELGEVINWNAIKQAVNKEEKVESLRDIDFDIKSLTYNTNNQKGVLLTEVEQFTQNYFPLDNPNGTQSPVSAFKNSLVSRVVSPKKRKMLNPNSQEVRYSGTTLSYEMYETQLKDMTQAPKLIYMPSKELMQRMILRSCFLKKSVLAKIIPQKQPKRKKVKQAE